MISAALSLDESCHNTCVQNLLPVGAVVVVCSVVSFGTFPSRYALLTGSRTVANNFDAKPCSSMNKGSARKYPVFTPA